MNYAYLFIDNLNGHPYEDGFNEIKASVTALKKNINPDDSIIVFNNELFGKNIEFFKQENIIHHYIDLSRNYNGSNDVNPISILVEKIVCLMNFDENEDIVLMDIDTSITQKIPENYFDSNHIIFDNIEYPIMQWRNLDKVLPKIPWKQFDISFDESFMMYNTGVIYIPKRFRKEVCERALKIVDYLNNNFNPEERFGNKLDEQIALSIVTHDCFGKHGYINFSTDYIHHYWSEKQNNIKWWQSDEFKGENQFFKLPISIGILSWKSNQTLRNTLESYKRNGLFDVVNDVTIFFQECSNDDISIANEYGIPFIAFEENIGIGRAFIKLSQVSRTDNVLLLEHDWELIEDKKTTFDRLLSGIKFLNSGYDCIRYRNRKNPGYPLFTKNVYEGNELNYYDEILDCTSPHLIECCHWIDDLEKVFPDKITKQNDHYVASGRWANFTNNPCMYKKKFYLNNIQPFENKGSLYGGLESEFGYWWVRQDFKVAWGEGLFKHNDIEKYGNQF